MGRKKNRTLTDALEKLERDALTLRESLLRIQRDAMKIKKLSQPPKEDKQQNLFEVDWRYLSVPKYCAKVK